MPDEIAFAEPHPYDSATKHFMERICALAGTMPMLLDVMHLMLKAREAGMEAFLRDHTTPHPSDPRARIATSEHGTLLTKLSREFNELSYSMNRLPAIVLISLVSEFDVLVGKLVEAMLRDRPEILNQSDKQMQFKDLMSFDDLEAARTYIIEKEVESVLRSSHAEQFKWLENRLGTTLRSGLDSWPVFIEITERRNLLVHTDGKVSSQYLNNCKAHGAPMGKDVKVGTMLFIDPAYFKRARDVILELGIKLSQVIWRRMRRGELAQSEASLVDASFSLLQMDMNAPASEVLKFFVQDVTKWESDERKLVCTINLAQSWKWMGRDKDMLSLIDQVQLGVIQDKYALAVHVLRDDFVKAAELVKLIGANGRIKKEDYRDWPLFKEFRKSSEFAEAFLGAFGQTFVEYEAVSKQVRDAIRQEANRHFEPDSLKKSLEERQKNLKQAENGDAQSSNDVPEK